MKGLVIALAALTMMACSAKDLAAVVGNKIPITSASPKTATQTVAKAPLPHCIILYIQAQLSVAPVLGVWNCLTPSVQKEYLTNSSSGSPRLDFNGQPLVGGDNVLAGPTDFTRAYYDTREHTGGYVIEIIGQRQGNQTVLTFVIYVDSYGKISAIDPNTPVAQN